MNFSTLIPGRILKRRDGLVGLFYRYTHEGLTTVAHALYQKPDGTHEYIRTLHILGAPNQAAPVFVAPEIFEGEMARFKTSE